MAIAETRAKIEDRWGRSPLGESTIVRQMAELVDAMSADDAESVSAMSDVAACLQLLSRASPSSAGSTEASVADHTPTSRNESGQLSKFAFAGDRFEIRRMLGHGGFGVVLLALDRRLGREIAMKVPRPEILASRNMRQQFLHEAQAAAALDHPNIVPVYDTGEIGPVCFITSRYVPGPTLSEWFREQEAQLPPNRASALVAMIAEAVHYAHSRGVLHRDLKPANVLLESTNETVQWEFPFVPRLSDFGLSRRLDDIGQLTNDKSLVGTPRYMAPEQAARKNNEVGIQTDVYALGAILYELLTGRTPHAADTDAETLRRIVAEPVSDSPLAERRVPRDLQAICLKTLQKAPSDRYESAGALATDLRRFLRNEPVAAHPVGPMERTIRWCRRRPLQAALLSVIAAVTASGLAGIAWQWRRAEQNLVLANVESARAQARLQQLELAFVDLAWVFDEADIWSLSTEEFPVLLQDKFRRYAESVFPEYLEQQQAVPKPLAAALYAMSAKFASLNGKSNDAEQNYHNAINLWCEALQENPAKPEYSRAFAITLFGYAAHLVKSGNLKGSVHDFKLVQQMFAKLRLSSDEEIKAYETYADLMTNLGYARARHGKGAESIAALQLANQMWHDLVQRSPKASFRVTQATTLMALAARQNRLARDFGGALAKTREARRLLEEAIQLEPSQRLAWQPALASSIRDEAAYTYRTAGPTAAIPLYDQAIGVYSQFLRDQQADPAQREALGNVNLECAQRVLEARGYQPALPYLEACAQAWTSLLTEGSLSKANKERLAMVYCQIGQAAEQNGQNDKAIAKFRQSIDLATKNHRPPDYSRSSMRAIIESNSHLADLLSRNGQSSEAERCLRRALDLLKKRSSDRPDDLNLKQQLSDLQSKFDELKHEMSSENKTSI
jgi:serine/threonine protein kinase/tetratricopeptide (TPR) repeat protein